MKTLNRLVPQAQGFVKYLTILSSQRLHVYLTDWVCFNIAKRYYTSAVGFS